MAVIVDPKSAAESGMTYDQLQKEAMQFLVHCGQLTMIEQAGNGHPAISANECLGMATRVIAEQALQIQAIADAEELRS